MASTPAVPPQADASHVYQRTRSDQNAATQLAVPSTSANPNASIVGIPLPSSATNGTLTSVTTTLQRNATSRSKFILEPPSYSASARSTSFSPSFPVWGQATHGSWQPTSGIYLQIHPGTWWSWTSTTVHQVRRFHPSIMVFQFAAKKLGIHHWSYWWRPRTISSNTSTRSYCSSTNTSGKQCRITNCHFQRWVNTSLHSWN